MNLSRTRQYAILLSIFAALALAGCRRKTPAPSSQATLPITHMRIGSDQFTLEIATSQHDQEVGLMHRDHLADDHGMLFIFSDEDIRTFWNHDVHFPLDLLFLDAHQSIVSIKQMDAYSDRNVSSDFPAQYVIELNRGTAARIGATRGMRLQVPPDALNAPPTTQLTP